MKKRNIVPIFSEADRGKAEQILALLYKRGLARSDAIVEGKTPGKGDIALLLLSQSFAADEEAQARFFAADSANAAVVPVELDGAAQPELVRNALIAKNAISAQGRTDEEIAERVASADFFQDPPPPPWIPRLLIALAAVLILGAAAWIFFVRDRDTEPEVEGPVLPALSQSELAAAQKFGLTAEDLARITSFAIIGDRVEFTQARLTTDSDISRSGKGFFLGDVAYESWDWNSNIHHWYSAEDGHEYAMKRYEDLSVIELMPNLRSLTLILVESDKLPALSGLEKLDSLTLSDCALPNLDWIEGSKIIEFRCAHCGLEDATPLSSCPRVRDADFELSGQGSFTLAGKCAESLHTVSIRGDGALRQIDLSGLSTAALWELHLTDLPLTDLSFLLDQSDLSQVELTDLRQLRSADELGSLDALSTVWLNNLPRVQSLAQLGHCPRLKDFNMNGMRQIRDLKFLNNCKSLQSVNLGDVDLDDLSFLEVMSKNFGISLSVNGQVRDWSALSQCSFYGSLEIAPDDRRVAEILPYLEGCSVSDLRIGNASDLDVSALPKISSRLSLWNCSNVTDLSGLSDQHTFAQLELQDMPRLSSLNGLQRIRSFGRNGDGFNCELWIDNCPRLEDWSAVNGCRFSNIRIKRVYTLPDFGKLNFYQRTVVRLENIPDVTDMSFLDGVTNPEKIYFNFELLGLDDLRDLSALRRFRGEKLVVTPELEPYAQALVDSKNFQTVEIDFPSGGWSNDYSNFALLSLDELDTLSDKMLSHVSSVCLAGDQLVDRERYDVWDEWDRGKNRVYIVERATGERTEVKLGGYADLSALSKLTGLRRLELQMMPLTSLDGIQVMSELEELHIRSCPKLTDASAAFTLQNLRDVEVGDCPITSIQGIQNLTELQSLGIYGTKIKDLSPLREVDYSASVLRGGGFALSVGGTNCDDYSPLEAVPVFSYLDLNGTDAARWPDLSKVEALHTLSAHSDNLTQAKLEELLEAHPELIELQIPHNEKISDLTPLLGMENLQRVLISSDMKKAVASIEGQNVPFELEIWQ